MLKGHAKVPDPVTQPKGDADLPIRVNLFLLE